MLFDLKIETIGKIMFGVILFSLSVIAWDFLPTQFTQAANGDASSITIAPENGIQQSNKINVSVNTDGFNTGGLTFLYKIDPATTSLFTNSSGLVLSSNNLGSGVIEINLSYQGNQSFTGTKFLGTITVDPQGTSENNVQFSILKNYGNAITKLSYGGSGPNIATVPAAYTVKKNDVPQVTIQDPVGGLTSANYNTPLTITLNDPTDNKDFTRNISLERPGIPGNLFTTYYNDSAFPSPSSTFTHVFTLKQDKFLEYNTEYIFKIEVKDDQNGTNGFVSKTFKVQSDQTPPPAPESVRVTSMNWSNTPGATVMNFEFRGKSLHEPFVPEDIEKFIVFRRADIGNSLVKNSEGGVLSWSGDGNYFNTTIKPKLVSAEANASSSVHISLSSAMKDNDRFETSIKNTDLGINNSKDNFLKNGTIYFIVAKDKGGNYSQPVHIIKLGDVRGISTSGLPDGKISIEDAKYIFQNGKDPLVCPIPAPSSIPSTSQCAKAS